MINRPISGSTFRPSLFVFAVFSVALFALHQPAQGFQQMTSGTSSAKVRQQAAQAIPFNELNPATQQKIQSIVQKPSIYRRLPITAIEIDPDYFVYLVRHPEVIVNIWKIMGVTQMSTTRTGPFSLNSNDGVGTISDVELVYGTKNMHIFVGKGTYEGPILKRKLSGECVIVLRTQYGKSQEGKSGATSQLDVFLKIENATAGLIAKTLNPLVGSTADHNFVESLKFLERLNETSENNGPGVQHMAKRLTDLNRDVRQKFIEVSGLVYQRNQAVKAAPAKTDATRGFPTSYQQPAETNQRPNYPVGATNQQVPQYQGYGVAPSSMPQVHYQQPMPLNSSVQRVSGMSLGPANGIPQAHQVPVYSGYQQGYPQTQQRMGQRVSNSYLHSPPNYPDHNRIFR